MFGISSNNLPLFIGEECVIEYFKKLRIKNRDIHRDRHINAGPVFNNLTEQREVFKTKGWVDIHNSLVDLDELLAFIGVSTLYSNGNVFGNQKKEHSPIPLKLIKFRHHQGRTQARVAFPISSVGPDIPEDYYGWEEYTEIFIYRRLKNVAKGTSNYGINIYDEKGNLKYRDGLKLLDGVEIHKINFTNLDNINHYNFSYHRIEIGKEKCVLQTSHLIRTSCKNSFNQWVYGGSVVTSCLGKEGVVYFKICDMFSVYDKKRVYPSYAKGGEYQDNVISVDHILCINKPNN